MLINEIEKIDDEKTLNQIKDIINSHSQQLKHFEKC